MRNQQGYIALITVLIISAISLLIAINANLFGISESDMGFIKNQASESYYLANACAEYALIELKDNQDYSGEETLAIGAGTCSILKIRGQGNRNRIVQVTGSVYNLTRKIEINIAKIDPEMEIQSWKEVSDF